MKYETQNTGIENMRYDFMPVGSIVPFASDIIPIGWLLCDGTPIERSQYPELYDLIGDKLPDHRGMFLRGNDNGRGVDPNRELGSEQGDAIRNITGGFTADTNGSGTYGALSEISSIRNAPARGSTSYEVHFGLDASRVVPTAEENRPKNNSVNYIIKALHIANPSMEYQVADGLNHKIETNRNNIDFNLLATLGISYGGILNNTNPKLAGVAYYDEIARKLFKCIRDTNIDYADTEFFEAISNNDLVNRLDSLNATEIKTGIKYSGIIPVGSFEIINFTFDKPFKKPPVVVASMSSGLDFNNPNGVTDRQEIQVYGATVDGFTARWYNLAQSNNNGRIIRWIAIA